MKKEIILSIKPENIHNSLAIKNIAARECGLSSDAVSAVTINKRSLDARGKKLHYTLQTSVYIDEYPQEIPKIKTQLKTASSHRKVLIIGAGPCGYFAALELLRYGIKPIILERGKDARARRRDLRAIQQFGIVNPHSNYCFGEGGAGTYSDGKLYTSSKKRGDIRIVLQLLVEHGAPDDILIDAHPHIGSNKLPIVVQNIRHTICEYGGEVHFDSYVTDIQCADTFVRLTTENGKEFIGDDCIIATGHSARDIFYLLHTKNIAIEAKPFALGVRAEHPQDLIDEIQYHGYKRGEYLPASSYKLVTHVHQRGVFSFCMCPGGLIVPAATAPEEIIVNGMSMSRRDSAYANSGIICAVSPEHASEHVESGVFSCLDYQKHIEKNVWNLGNGTQQAPAQRLIDFVNGRLSDTLPKSSYIPGLISAPVEKAFTKDISTSLHQGFKDFDKKMRGYFTNEAIVVATESRTSSPVKIPRNKETLAHINIPHLYPAGEGAGYAGGIMSAALDGKAIAEKIAQKTGLFVI